MPSMAIWKLEVIAKVAISKLSIVFVKNSPCGANFCELVNI